MLQTKENQQKFNIVKENILPANKVTKSIQTNKTNALQPIKSMQSIQQQSIKPSGLQVSKQSTNNVQQSKSSNVLINKPVALQSKPVNTQQQITKGKQNL